MEDDKEEDDEYELKSSPSTKNKISPKPTSMMTLPVGKTPDITRPKRTIKLKMQDQPNANLS